MSDRYQDVTIPVVPLVNRTIAVIGYRDGERVYMVTETAPDNSSINWIESEASVSATIKAYQDALLAALEE